MKKLLYLVFALSTLTVNAQNAQPATLFGAEAYDIPSKIMKSNIRVSVSVPMGYDAKAAIKYPVLYVLDAFYSFPLMHEMHKIMSGEIEPVIIVGIGDDRMSLPEWIISRYPVLNFDNVAYEDSFHVANLLRGAPVKLHSGDGAQYYDAACADCDADENYNARRRQRQSASVAIWERHRRDARATHHYARASPP